MCAADVAEARHNEAWKHVPGLDAGGARHRHCRRRRYRPARRPRAIALSLVTSTGLACRTRTPRTVTAALELAAGEVLDEPGRARGRPTLAVTLAAGTDTTFYYQDTRAGSHTLTASAAGTTNGTQVVTVTAGPVATVAVTPAAGEVRARGLRRFTARRKGHLREHRSRDPLVEGDARERSGRSSPGNGGTATFTAGRLLRAGTVTAGAQSTISASAAVTVIARGLRIGSIASRRSYALPAHHRRRPSTAHAGRCRAPPSGSS